MHGTARATVDLYKYVVGLARAGLDNLVCFTELIDNSLDAQATSVRIVVKNGKEFRIHDNGTGIPDITSLVCFGGHVSHRSTQSGMYGVGFKDAALVLGGEGSKVTVSTRSGGTRTACTIDWHRLKDTDECMEWHSDADVDAVPGTQIAIQPLKQRFPEGDRREKLLSQLGYIYSPAIKRGAVIQITTGTKATTLAPWKLPLLEDVVDERIEIGGKRARLHAGIVPKGERNDRPGLTYSHGFRVIKRAGSAGCGAWSINRICGFVEIDERRGWHRTKNKTDLVEADDLYEEVERRLTPLLQKAAEHAHSIDIEGARSSLEGLVAEALLGPPDEKARRGAGDELGTKNPTGNGKKHTRAKQTQRGATFGRRHVSTIRLEFRDGWSAGEPLGLWEVNQKSASIALFSDHPLIRRAMCPWNSDALFVAAMAVVSVSRDSESPAQLGWVGGHGALVKLAEYTGKLDARLDGRLLAEAAE